VSEASLAATQRWRVETALGFNERMTCALVTPWWRQRSPAVTDATELAGSVAPTRILDWRHPRVRDLLDELRHTQRREADVSDAALLRAVHRLVSDRIRPVYAVDDTQPVSRTLRLGRGSCSQRLAIVEAIARAAGIPTRVRGFVVAGEFWYPRFPRLRRLVPDRVVLAWPEFWLGGRWLEVAELFGTLPELSANAGGGFTNADGETLFDAIARTAVDWNGRTSTPISCSSCDLSANVLVDLGRFSSRDLLFARHGQTLCLPSRVLAGPFLGRWRHRPAG
jgi:transglutaminase-like putative cysteine protease